MRTRTVRVCIAAAACCLLLGCGNEAIPPRKDCALTTTLTGAVDMKTDGPQLCSLMGIYEPGPRVVVSFIELTPALHMSFALSDMTEGGVGSFSAEVGIAKQPGPGGWKTSAGACTVVVTEHTVTQDEDPEHRIYRYVGNGSCSQPAAGDSDSPGAVNIGDFSVKALIGWNR